MKYTEIKLKISCVLSVLLLLSANNAPAQNVALVISDPAVKSGVLPNGMKWYVAANSYVKGAADFALVQATGATTVQSVGRERIVDIAQESLLDQPLLTAPSVQEYFISKGSIPGLGGFAEVDDNVTVYRFGNVNLKISDSVMDSTLLVLMNIAGRYSRTEDNLIRKWYTPSDQAVIVAGDIDASSVADKIHMLSYMLPSAVSVPRQGYLWQEQEGVEVETGLAAGIGLAEISAVWRMERTPREQMNTIQPAIYEKYMTMTGYAVRDRIAKQFESMGIPVADIECRYTGGSDSLGDYGFTVSVTLSDDRLTEGLSVLAGVVSSISTHGVDVGEAARATYDYSDHLVEDAGTGNTSNEEYVDRCISAFLYNAPLSSKSDIRKFFASRHVSDTAECELMKSIASASLRGDRNLKLKIYADGLSIAADSLKTIFSDAWSQGQSSEPDKSESAYVPYLPSPETKVRVSKTKKEPLSGGVVWTLSNGMKIMFRDMQTEEDMVYYSLSLNGGTGNIDGLETEDGGYLSDYLKHCKIGGVSGRDFRNAVRRHGMTIDCNVGHSTTTFEGAVPKDEMNYLFRVLLAVMNERAADKSQWDYYLAGEPLRQSKGCSSGKGACLEDGFAAKAESFYRTLSQNVNNGMIVLVGDIDEVALKKAVEAYAGGFHTSDKTFSRTETSNRNFSGMDQVSRKGTQNSVDMTVTAPLSLTAENYYTAAMTAMTLRRHLVQEFAGKGMSVELSHECRRYPRESIQIRISVSEASVEGFASGTEAYSAETALSTLKDIFSDLSSVDVGENILSSYRYRLDRHLQLEKNNPKYWVNALNLRYLGGKDFTTGAEAKIKAVTGKNVRALLSTLEEESKIEYVITGK